MTAVNETELKQGFRQYRPISKGEYFVVGGDCSQGGKDFNFAHFLSVTRRDIPLVYEKRGVAATMTDDVFYVLGKLFQITGIPPLVAFERQNGGASEMERLDAWNVRHEYKVFRMPIIGKDQEKKKTKSLGWDTSKLTRPLMLGEAKKAYDTKQFKIYDKRTHQQFGTFVINERTGKPEADKNHHDDAVMSFAIANQLFIREPVSDYIASDASVLEEPEWVEKVPKWSGNKYKY